MVAVLFWSAHGARSSVHAGIIVDSSISNLLLGEDLYKKERWADLTFSLQEESPVRATLQTVRLGNLNIIQQCSVSNFGVM
jgi:hypothetical protein